MTIKKQVDCLIIGSGICGLIAANRLSEAGFSVLVLDKGRGSGGRLATRRVNADQGPEGVVDYGAPLFSVQTPLLQSLATDWIRAGIIREWKDDTSDNMEKQYIGLNGMRGIAKHLAGEIEVVQSEKVTGLKCDSHWTVITEKENRYHATALVLTAPLPQALTLLDENRIELDQTSRKQLDQIEYDPCMAVFGILNSPSKLKMPGAFFIKEGPIKWIADHQKRGISEIPTYTAHMTAAYSQESWDIPEEQLISRISPEVEQLLGAKLTTIRMHRWKYATAKSNFSRPFYLQKQPLPLILAGDGFTAGGVEGAVLSGIAVAEEIINRIS